MIVALTTAAGPYIPAKQRDQGTKPWPGNVLWVGFLASFHSTVWLLVCSVCHVQVRGSHGLEMCFGLASWLHFMALYGFSAQCSLVCTVAIVCVHEFTVYISLYVCVVCGHKM